MYDLTWKDKIRIETICDMVGAAPNILRWFGCLQARPVDATVTMSDSISVDGIARGGEDLTWDAVVKYGMHVQI